MRPVSVHSADFAPSRVSLVLRAIWVAVSIVAFGCGGVGAAAAAQVVDRPAVAAAASSVTIVDDADVLSSSAESRIRSAARELPDDVRLYVATSDIRSGELTDWLDDQGSRVGWSGSGAASSALILAVAPKIRKMDAHWGSGVDLDDYEESIFSAMSSDFGSGDWSGGLISGVETAAAGLSGDLSGDDSGSYSGNGSSGHSGWWTLLVIALILLAVIGWGRIKKFGQARAERAAAQAEQRRREELRSANQITISELRPRLDQDQLLVPSIPDSPLQDQLELDLTSAQSDLRFAEAIDDADEQQRHLRSTTESVGSLDRRIALLRKAPGWEVAWSQEIDAARLLLRSWSDAVEMVSSRYRAAPVTGAVPEQSARDLDGIETQVRDQSITLETGLGRLMTVERAVRGKLKDITTQLDALKEAAQQAAEAARRKERAAQEAAESRYHDDGSGSSGFSWSSFFLGNAMGRSTFGGRRYGGGWGGGWGGGRSFGRSGGGSRSFGGGGFSRGGGGFSRGGGGGGSRSF